MAIGETLVTVVGNVCSDLSKRTTATGDEVVSFWLRSNERRFDKDAGAWRDGRHFAVKVTCWRRIAGTVGASLAKGDPVIVNGRLYTSEFEVEGQQRSVPELEALAIGPNLSWCTATVRRLGRQREPGAPGGPGGPGGAEPRPAALGDDAVDRERAPAA
ncbi:single-stranded DNA-binding protein [Prauserella muralis]|uniref:Single-stranded DNA-binding protein n=1 Tax=Prauserella muralis TaxID=588067 RepID=A0A2V4AZT4_9PSEU|nr:single-stranded DNA-binding protein [Prauserella muralis]PXY27454.1 single-stranded DNA-binding protein [Prauserella muralis]TWE22844.1 single-strand DNA-binding protein [Prauserella muralis]